MGPLWCFWPDGIGLRSTKCPFWRNLWITQWPDVHRRLWVRIKGDENFQFFTFTLGIGPSKAIPAVLKKANLTKKDIDLFEINEAFASQSVYCIKKLGIDMKKVNPVGGAIALGHPLGCTGARMMATMVH